MISDSLQNELLRDRVATLESALLKIQQENHKYQSIFARITEICDDDDGFVSFSNDFGGNQLTVEISGKGHSHIGIPDGDFDVMIDHLYNLMCENQGLSFVQSAEQVAEGDEKGRE